ncbi:mitochondrial ribosomal protein L4 [Dermatophagoides farinae]|uniref:Large ribosomal subunit protein uL4m n=1 Tax=Dermatophagoides farinae TaxID=6954 RepID=A0A922HST8_DERFA|nr:39S ribosomal protein L4, mitochondrial-like [Dermatophagoides farinae]KAH7640222.1 39s ribosomal protein l4 [Dermatophagoides farinae]KAH9502108.1 54S ribosomal protein L4 mitochondrial [Dermatophagoides farinae]
MQSIPLRRFIGNYLRRSTCNHHAFRIMSTATGGNLNDVESAMEPTQTQIISQSQVIDPILVNIARTTLTDTNIAVTPIRQAWIENMSTPNSIKLGLMELHPNIFSIHPRPDVIQENHKWQTLYKHVDWTCMKTRSELRGSNRKPWPQKGTGRARHGSRRAPMWIGGGWATGPRGPKTYFYMLPFHKRLAGLISTLTSKLAQNDLHIVDTFETFPLDGTVEHLEELCETRGWGPSVLFVDQIDVSQYPMATSAQHFQQACESINHMNVMPVYGLNVYSMLKHETLVLTIDAIRTIEQRLLFNLNRIDLRNVTHKQHPNPIRNM